MPRLKNFEIDSRDELIEQLMTKVFEEKIFLPNEKYTIKEKAEFLNWQAEKNQVRLAVSELRDKFLSPYSKKEPIRLSREYGIKIATFLYRVKQAFDLTEEMGIIDKFRARFEAIPKAGPQADEYKNIMHKLFGNRTSLLGLINSTWNLYERIGDQPVRDSSWGIAVGEVKFLSGPGCVLIETIFKFDSTIRKYVGIASHDAKSDYLFIDQIAVDDTRRRSNIVLRMADMDYNDQTIMIGHYTYHSKKYMHLLSKSVVMQKTEVIDAGDNDRVPIGDYLRKEEKYNKIPLTVRQFLYWREKNRMSLPQNIIGSISQLQDFLKIHKEAKNNRILKRHIKGKFLVYYKRINQIIAEDELEIDLNPESLLVEAQFSHIPDNAGKNKKKWLGTAYYNTQQNVVLLELSNDRTIDYTDDEDPVLLTFLLPNDTLAFSECECFYGIISGLADVVTGPVSFKCLIVKKGLPDFHGLNDQRIKNIFDAENNLDLSIKQRPDFNLNDFCF